MNIRKSLLFLIFGFRGVPYGKYYQRFSNEFLSGIVPDTTQRLLAELLKHCQQNVPYYSKIIEDNGFSINNDPFEDLKRLPILTREILRSQFENLKSIDFQRRKWFINSSGGSTGVPIQFIQDLEYAAKAGAIKSLYSKLIGKEIGERELRLWGNVNDIKKNSESMGARIINFIENATFRNTQLMTPQKMREYLSALNSSKVKLIVSYAQAIYELAKFAEQEGIHVIPQNAIITSASKLYTFMREEIERIFHCSVYDRYGSREVGDMACEIPNHDGLWVAPWGNYLEIVDAGGNRVPDGIEGDILVTSLSNYSMPLIRYKIGDRGIFVTSSHEPINNYGQVLKEVTGRIMDLFVTKEGNYILPGYFMANLAYREWIAQFQIIQKSHAYVLYKIVKCSDPCQSELDDIIAITKEAMGKDCQVVLEFVENILPTASGKYKFLISEIQ